MIHPQMVTISDGGGGSRKILSIEELEAIRNSLKVIRDSSDNYLLSIQTVINSFDNQDVVQSFYSSGKFGQAQKERLQEIYKAVQDYTDVITSAHGLIYETTRYTWEQQELREQGK